jgi:hypothetical protein
MKARRPKTKDGFAKTDIGNHDSGTDECQAGIRNARGSFYGEPDDSSHFDKQDIRRLDDSEP